MIDANIVAKWIWDNDFKPIVGQKFQFRAEPNEWWDGIADGEVLAVNEPNHLKYTWASQSESTTITWTLHGEFDGKTIFILNNPDLVRKPRHILEPYQEQNRAGRNLPDD